MTVPEFVRQAYQCPLARMLLTLSWTATYKQTDKHKALAPRVHSDATPEKKAQPSLHLIQRRRALWRALLILKETHNITSAFSTF